jgi:outer membrane lipoprotein-sorting protein
MRFSLTAAAVLLAAAGASAPRAQDNLTAKEIIERVEDQMRSNRSVAELEMRVVTPKWRRTMLARSYDDREEDRSFIHILSPKRDEDTTFLRRGKELWMFRPSVERTTKIPPSMMHNSWMGSDFSNDDLVKESSYITDYDHELVGTEEFQGRQCYNIKMTPKPDKAITWSRVEVLVLLDPPVPVRYRFYNRRGELDKEMILPVDSIKEMGGRRIPTLWIMQPMDKPGNHTEIEIKSMEFDAEMPEGVFTQRALENPPR